MAVSRAGGAAVSPEAGGAAVSPEADPVAKGLEIWPSMETAPARSAGPEAFLVYRTWVQEWQRRRRAERAQEEAETPRMRQQDRIRVQWQFTPEIFFLGTEDRY